jgi:hypothetical protein
LKSCDESAPGPDGISYEVYKKLWPEIGQYLLDAWRYSEVSGILPVDHRVSCITLIPKTGKDLEHIENWRPITLTNCDLKIFTKLLANRVSTVLDKLISQSQTAYIPGRVVHDNLRVFDFYKNYCKKHNVDALLISLDAKKAFDSVSHKYMWEVLRSYGFSENFIETVKLLYKDLKANILVNGFKSVIINIERSVKQGDALSCALFILCIDPLIRKLENNENIECIPIPRSVYSNIKIKEKVGAFADDVGLAVKNNLTTINAIFNDYSLFSRLSGIELNLSKTEILKLNLDTQDRHFVPSVFQAGGVVVKSTESIKICGITFSNNVNVEYEKNIIEKINSLEKQIVRWLPRCLSVEGKITIVKTFGLSQLIYSLQMCEIKEKELNNIESIIFRFLWNKSWVGNRAPDRIKRSIMKAPYDKGGLNCPDIKNLDMALKTKQFIRSMQSKHHINLVQKYVLEKDGYFEYHKIEYSKISDIESVTAGYQITTNLLTDRIRKISLDQNGENEVLLGNKTDMIASTDIIEYFRRKRIPLALYRFRLLANQGIETFHELVNEFKYPRDDQLRTCAQEILTFFPKDWIELVGNVSNINSEITLNGEYYTYNWQVVNSNVIKVKNLRNILTPITKIEPPFLNYDKFELSTDDLDFNPFTLARTALHAPRDRFYKFRILHGDIFCNKRMFKFKMTNSPNCAMCPETVETIKHVLWECPRASRAWKFLNDQTKEFLGFEYVCYRSVILGQTSANMAMESMITWVTKMIMSIDRSNLISNEAILAKFKTLFYYEQKTFGLTSKKMRARWGNIMNKFR